MINGKNMTKQNAKLLSVIGYIVLVVGLLVGRLISSSSTTADENILNQWLAGESALNIILPVLGVILVVIGIKYKKSGK